MGKDVCSMRVTKEELSIRVVVRRRARGATPFAWEIHQADIPEPIYVSPERFSGMEAAYRAGKARLSAFVRTRLSMPCGGPESRFQAAQIGLPTT
jgi:hypothetical protein